jgi:hypothetical protein
MIDDIVTIEAQTDDDIVREVNKDGKHDPEQGEEDKEVEEEEEKA